MLILLSCLIAVFATAISISLLRPLAIRLGLVDTPQGRKQHQGQIPLIGGIAVFLGFLFALLTLPISLAPFRGFIAASALLIFIGVLDDFHELPARSRFIAQIFAAILMVAWGQISLHNLGNLFFYKDILLHNWSWPVTIFAVIGIINAVNMIDGMDGLAGGLALIQLAFLSFLAIHAGQLAIVYILLALCSAILGFLFFNFPIPKYNFAKIFMGDAGSMFLGFTLVWFMVQLSQAPVQAAKPITMLWIMLVPLFDIGGVMVRRFQKRQSLFSPDREHIHHLLQAIGFSGQQVTWLLCGLGIVSGLIGVIADYLNIVEGVMFSAFIALFFAYISLINFLRKRIT